MPTEGGPELTHIVGRTDQRPFPTDLPHPAQQELPIATATRDLQDLAEENILIPTGSGRSTHYKINL
ncbi:MAG: hypothetical protein P0120_05425 [Nitrospira sp.]|nr:hypothetical protein [Nitrospira sp.]